jgi:transposase
MASDKQTEYEVLRRRCATLYQQGWKQVTIAQALGLTQGWVSRTLTKYRQQGQDALAWRKPVGSKTKLSDSQLAELVEELSKGAEYHGFPGHIWTRPRVNEVIKKLFAISYHPSQVGRILKKVGWSRQKPQTKARQQKPEQVAHWREERLPELKKSPN